MMKLEIHISQLIQRAKNKRDWKTVDQLVRSLTYLVLRDQWFD